MRHPCPSCGCRIFQSKRECVGCSFTTKPRAPGSGVNRVPATPYSVGHPIGVVPIFIGQAQRDRLATEQLRLNALRQFESQQKLEVLRREARWRTIRGDPHD